MDSIGVKPGMIIGEAGAGRGYFTFYLAIRVGKKGPKSYPEVTRVISIAF